MPRPKNGYFNAAGQPIPAVGDINGRFMDRSRLLYWAFNKGRSGAKKLYDNEAIDVGSAVHTLCELDLQGRSADDIAFYAKTTLPDPEMRAKAEASFRAFKMWRAEFHVSLIAQEISLVSERLQVGGTLDLVARIRRGRGLIEFKTSSEVYQDHLMQMAAYGILWLENHPNEPFDEGYHLILLPKDGSPPIHREFTGEQLNPFRQQFWCYRRAYDFDKMTSDPKVLAGCVVAPSIVPEQAPEKPKRKARVSIPVTPKTMSMGELLRAYGHVREGVAA